MSAQADGVESIPVGTILAPWYSVYWCVMIVTGWMCSLLILGISFAACAQPEPARVSGVEDPEKIDAVIPLPVPNSKGALTLEETLRKRRSVREFTDRTLTLAEIGQLLWAAQGITGSPGYRTAPSAGALYPLEIYTVSVKEVCHYNPLKHELIVIAHSDVRGALHAAALAQESIRDAPVVIVIAAVYARTIQKYGPERSPRYVHMEAGHAAQNILLQAVALNLGAVPIGAFSDEEVKKALALPAEHQPLYLIPVGHPR